MATIDDLPDELVERLLLFLRPADRLSCAAVCRRWSELMCAPRMLTDVRVALNEGALSCAMDVLRKTDREYQSLRVSNGLLYDFNASFWERIGGSLVELNLDNCDLSSMVFFAILQTCCRLKSLELAGCSSLMMSDSLLRPPESVPVKEVQHALRGVRHLSLESNRFLTDASFHRLIELMPHLTSLSLDGCSNLQFHPGIFRRFHNDTIEFSSSVLTFQNVLACLVKCGSHVSSLDFSRTLINARAMAQLVGLCADHLVELRLNRCDQLTDKAFDSIAECTKLRVLSLGSTCQVRDTHLTMIFEKMHDLEHLDLSGCFRIRDQGCHAITQLQRLQFLSLYSCTEISNDALCGLRSLRRLRSLDMSFTNCDAMVFRSLSALSELRVLKLSNCKRLDDECLQLICTHLTKLEVLKMSYCILITDAGASLLHRLSALRKLTLTGAMEVTDRSLDDGLGAIDLRSLKLGLVSQLTDKALVSMALYHRALDLIDLSGCPQITDVGLISLVQCVPRLRKLYLKGCRSLTDRSLVAIRSHCPQLRRLVVEQCAMSEDAIDLFAHLRRTVDVN